MNIVSEMDATKNTAQRTEMYSGRIKLPNGILIYTQERKTNENLPTWIFGIGDKQSTTRLDSTLRGRDLTHLPLNTYLT